jgi:hypothetical protein
MKLKRFLEKQVLRASRELNDAMNTQGYPTAGLEKELKQAKKALAEYNALVVDYSEARKGVLGYDSMESMGWLNRGD